jgi:DNA polymerase III alpha subunit
MILESEDFVEVSSVEKLDYTEDVYDITVEDNHNFYANGLLVHNCVGGPLSFDIFQELQGIEFDNLDWRLLNDKTLMSRVMSRVGKTWDRITDAVGRENAHLELQFNSLPAQHLTNRVLIEFAQRENITDKLVVTCDSHYSRPERWREREIYKKLGRLNYEKMNPDALPKSIEELKCELYPKNAKQVWQTYHETRQDAPFYDDKLVKEAIERTWDIAHNFIGDVQPDRSVKLPSYVIPQGLTAIEALIKDVKQGLRNKGLHTNNEYVQRALYEIKVIRDKDFASYFLTMKEITRLGKEKMLFGPARGSSAGSLVCYVLGITDVDPIKYGLLFERFLSPDREGLPDIDTDVEDRSLLLKILEENFGTENIVPISNYNTFKLKSLIRDISRFYGLPLDEVGEALKTADKDVLEATKKVGDDKNLFVLTYDDAYNHSTPFREFIDRYPHIGESVKVLFRQNKSLGRHAGGVIISENIAERMPLIASRGEKQTPWVEGMNYKHLEMLGWVKYDLLGLETLRIIRRTIELIIANDSKTRKQKELTLEDGKKIKLFGDQLIKTNRGNIRVDELTTNDEIMEMPILL